MRRLAPGVFVLALIALLVVPVGGAARLTHHQSFAGPTQSKTAVSAARTPQAIAHADLSDRLQLDPTTPPLGLDAPFAVGIAAIDLPSASSVEGHGSDPFARGPPAL